MDSILYTLVFVTQLHPDGVQFQLTEGPYDLKTCEIRKEKFTANKFVKSAYCEKYVEPKDNPLSN